MVAQRSLVLLAAIFAAAWSQAPVARYLRGEDREGEEAPALHYFATDPEERFFCGEAVLSQKTREEHQAPRATKKLNTRRVC